MRPEDLRARAWTMIEHYFDRARTQANERYQMLRGINPALVMSYLRAIVPAAYSGRVDTLFLATGQRCWGRFDSVTGELVIHKDASPRDTELFDLAAVQTIRHSGTIYTIELEYMPDLTPIAAILRY